MVGSDVMTFAPNAKYPSAPLVNVIESDTMVIVTPAMPAPVTASTTLPVRTGYKTQSCVEQTKASETGLLAYDLQ